LEEDPEMRLATGTREDGPRGLMVKRVRKILLALLLLSVSASAQLRLPRLISDGMVLQRNSGVKIWGWTGENKEVSLRFLDSTYSTVAEKNGAWSLVLSGQQPGGPYEMRIESGNVITLSDIMIGDVWVCSGQSNMELSMRRVSPIYGKEIAGSDNPSIRLFSVPQRYDFTAPQVDLPSGSWRRANPENVLEFSAVAYFFAQQLHDKHKVPIGLINASLGGSPAESWMSEEALKDFPVHSQEAQRFKDSTLIRQIEQADNERIQAWYRALRDRDEGHKAPNASWYSPDANISGWDVVNIPGYWSETDLGPVNGVVWFRRTFDVPSLIAGKQAKLVLGRIVDADSVFINGVFVGTTSYQYPPRRYEISPTVLKEGENVIVVRVINSSGRGGFVHDKPYEIAAGSVTIDLKGPWQYRLGATMEPLASQTFIRWKPLGLYNAMLAPLLNTRIKGVIWYQGESNAARPLEYRDLFPSLIRNWRNDWQQGDFPFLFVQLPNFMESKNLPGESNWALLRESQMKALSLPKTGMAVAIDIGEWNDIHPLNKKEVGRRLALVAHRVAYGDGSMISSGPMYDSMRIEGDRIILTFSDIGSGLVVNGGGDLRQFSIAGKDKQFVWANAQIRGNEVVVWSEAIANPVAVRYAWADNPEGANLYNREGLPASPFRTDE
jgi:sialate O-acetylesterase